ncbi:MAG: DEAD/DEAH box helicase [Proteobacteria bacterium]|nr:DEAD/DEAH box helicase [Pseudomonadota bacterium]
MRKLTSAFPFQQEAIDAVADLDYAAIFFEQGLGKTKIAIDLALDWLKSNTVDTVIIVTKKGLIRNWQQEFDVHSHLKPKVISTDRAANHKALFSSCRIYITSYEAIALESQKFESLSMHRSMAIILDESQKIKNAESRLTKEFFKLSHCFKKRIIMTGTPMANRPYDIWSQIYFLDLGDALGIDFKEFKSSLDLPERDAKEKFVAELKSVMPRISSFALRQTKEGSGLELPGKVYQTVYGEWESNQQRMYAKLKRDLRIELLKDGKLVTDDSEAILKRLLRLNQIASNPRLVDDSYSETPGKIPATRSLVDRIVNADEKVIIWTSFVDNCRYLANYFKEYGAVQINGSMAIADRDGSVQKFKHDGDCKVLVATPAAAKEGLTLTVANHVIFFDRSFSLDDYLQAQDRIHRISQEKTCHVTNIQMAGSIDEWIDALITLKSSAVKVGMGDTDDADLQDVLSIDISDILDGVLNDHDEGHP